MHDIESIEYLKRFKQLPENRQCFFLAVPSLLLKRLHECPSIAILINKVVIIPRLEVIFIFDDEVT